MESYVINEKTIRLKSLASFKTQNFTSQDEEIIQEYELFKQYQIVLDY